MFRVVALLLLGGCNLVFGVGGSTASDANPDPVIDASGSTCWDPDLVGDEDRDMFADGCDPCPADTDLDGSSPDTDGDGVGDRCDVSSAAKHAWTTFAGFHDPAHGWTVTSGMWTVVNDALVSQDPLAGMIGIVVTPTAYPVVEARITDASSLNVGAYAGVALEFENATARCFYSYDSGADNLVLDVTGQASKTTPFNAPEGIRIRLFQEDNGRIACVAFSAAGMSSELDSDDDLTSTVATKMSLFAKLTAASFQWVSLYGRQP